MVKTFNAETPMIFIQDGTYAIKFKQKTMIVN